MSAPELTAARVVDLAREVADWFDSEATAQANAKATAIRRLIQYVMDYPSIVVAVEEIERLQSENERLADENSGLETMPLLRTIDALKARIGRLEQALRFYADAKHIQAPWVTRDQGIWSQYTRGVQVEGGTKARKALEQSDG